jgi:peptide/nickel transport system permease protein
MSAIPTTPTAGQAGAPEGAPAIRRSGARRMIRGLLRQKLFLIGAGILAFWILDAALAPLLLGSKVQALGSETQQAPSAAHWFGTDNLGRDVFARVFAGATAILTIAPLATLLGVVSGAATGLLMGYYRGPLDDLLSRIVDALLAFPLIIIAVLVLASLGRSELNVILVIAFTFLPLVARTVRSAVLAEREREYVAAARLRGESGPFIMVREILPNITTPIMVETTVRLGYAIFTAATLSFLGLGLSDPSPDWGLTISEGRPYMQTAPWVVIFPALALASLVIAVNLTAEGLRKAFDE